MRDAAILLNVLAAHDPLDPATQHLQRPADYTAVLDKDDLKGARIGLPSDPADPANDVYYGKLSPRSAQVMSEVVETLRAAGAEIVRANIPTTGWIGGPGTVMAVLNRNPESRTKHDPAHCSIVFVYEIKRDLNAYLGEWASETQIRTMADVIAFNDAHVDKALRFSQYLFLAAEATRGDLSEPEYRSARAMDLRSAARSVSMPIWTRIGSTRCCSPAGPGPRLRPRQVTRAFKCRPASSPLRRRGHPDCPLGATFTGRAWSEPTLLRLAYAFEQASQARRPPAWLCRLTQPPNHWPDPRATSERLLPHLAERRKRQPLAAYRFGGLECMLLGPGRAG